MDNLSVSSFTSSSSSQSQTESQETTRTSREKRIVSGGGHQNYLESETKKRKRAMKERKRVSNLGSAYQALALTIGLFPNTYQRGQRRVRITHEQILRTANEVIKDLKSQLDHISSSSGKVMVVKDAGPAVAQYTLSSSGEVLYVEHEGSDSHNLFACNETLPLPLDTEESPNTSITSSVPLMSYELVSPPQGPEPSQFFLGEYPRQAFLFSSPTF